MLAMPPPVASYWDDDCEGRRVDSDDDDDDDRPGPRDEFGQTEEPGYLQLSQCPHHERAECVWVAYPFARKRPFPCGRCPEGYAPYLTVDLAANTVLGQYDVGTVASALRRAPEAYWFYRPYREFPHVVRQLDADLIPHVDWGRIRAPVETFWSRRVHAACRGEDREVVLAVLLCARRLAGDAGGLPPELWAHLLSFLPVVAWQVALAGRGDGALPPVRRGSQMQLGPA